MTVGLVLLVLGCSAMLALARTSAAPRLDRAAAARLLGADLERLEDELAGRAPDARCARTRTGLRVDQAAAPLSVLTDGKRVSMINAPACGCRKLTRPGDIRESRPRRDRAAGPGTDPDP